MTLQRLAAKPDSLSVSFEFFPTKITLLDGTGTWTGSAADAPQSASEPEAEESPGQPAAVEAESEPEPAGSKHEV